MLLDGTLIRTRRRAGKANRKNHSGKHKSRGLLFLALTDERGNLIRISSARRCAACGAQVPADLVVPGGLDRGSGSPTSTAGSARSAGHPGQPVKAANMVENW